MRTDLATMTLACVVAAACVPPPEREPAGTKEPPPIETADLADANGWGEGIAWRSLEDAQRVAKETGRPMMMVVWTDWCSKCKALKRRFFEPELQQLSQRFVMVNVDQEAHEEVLGYAPDGPYIPRILFFDRDGEVDRALTNPRRNSNRYFYMPHDDLLGVMKAALKRHAKAS